jgi:hypothetical protein
MRVPGLVKPPLPAFAGKREFSTISTANLQHGLMTDAERLVRDDISAASRRYLEVLQGKEHATLYDLAKALDELVATYHRVPEVEPDRIDGPAAPRTDERPIIDAAAASFPELDWFALVDPQAGEEQQVWLSMALGDLSEIASDLLEVLWLFENASHNEAVWEFRFGYRFHWGRHLHEVRTYLHALAAW